MPDTTASLLSVLIPALVGAGLMAFLFQPSKRKEAPSNRNTALIATIAGGAAGAIGSLLFMLPLNFCVFEPEREAADVLIGVVFIIAGTLAAIAPTVWLLRRLFNRQPIVADSQPGAFKGSWLPWLLLAPTLIILLLFLYYPSIDNFRLSTLLTRLGQPKTAFVCVRNFSILLDVDYARIVAQTFLLSGAIVVVSMALSLLVATVAYLPVRGASIYRTLLIWPYAVSPAVAGIIFQLIFNPLGGLLNYGLDNLFHFTVPWFTSTAAAPWMIILASVWKSMGFNILFFIAGLQNIPKDLLEAGAIDGANVVQRFFRITLPLLSPISFFLLITNMTYAFFETFGTIDYLTRGGPVGSTTTMMYQIYSVGVEGKDLGKGAAQAIVLFLVVIGLTLVQFRTSGERVNYGA